METKTTTRLFSRECTSLNVLVVQSMKSAPFAPRLTYTGLERLFLCTVVDAHAQTVLRKVSPVLDMGGATGTLLPSRDHASFQGPPSQDMCGDDYVLFFFFESVEREAHWRRDPAARPLAIDFRAARPVGRDKATT